MVEKAFWRLIDITIVNTWIIFRANNLTSPIDAQKKFRLNFAENLVQPLLDLLASPTCPEYSCGTKGRRPVSAAKCLIGKHFAYKTRRGEGILFVGIAKPPLGNEKILQHRILYQIQCCSMPG